MGENMYGLGSAKNIEKVFTKIASRGEEGLSSLKNSINRPDYERIHRFYKLSEMYKQTTLSRSTYKRQALLINPGSLG